MVIIVQFGSAQSVPEVVQNRPAAKTMNLQPQRGSIAAGDVSTGSARFIRDAQRELGLLSAHTSK